MGVAVQPDDHISPANPDCADLIKLFAQCFGAQFNTRLAGGGSEPEYLPADAAGNCARIVFTRDYFASALHEIAHWCLAGAERRQLADYGYWYAPDGRNTLQQQAFERVEVKPQALEWLFAEAAGFRFCVSADNLGQPEGPSATFKSAIARQARHYLSNGLPPRAAAFTKALMAFYGTRLCIQKFDVSRL
jgi:elongation factor P hydroxylase